MIKSINTLKKELLQRNDIKYIRENKDTNEQIEDILGIRKEIWDALDNDKPIKYKDDYVFDENKSVKWNREEVQRKNNEYSDFRQTVRNLYSAFDEIIKDVIIEYISYDYNIHNKEMAEIIYYAAYEDGHDSGYYSVIQFADEYLEIFDQLKRADTK